MTRENMRYKLIVPNSGNEVYNKGIRIANSRANKLFKQIFDYFELSINEAKRIQKDNERLKILFDSEFCRCSKCGEYKRSGFGCYCENDNE